MSFPVNYLDTVDDRALIKSLDDRDLVATRQCSDFAGQIARVQIDVFGDSAADVESTLLEYASRCDEATEAGEVLYGRCVIERNLQEEWGATYSWKGRLTLNPTIGTATSSERAVAAIDEMLYRDPR